MTWRHFLAAHPDQEMIQFFLQGLATGFKVGFAYHHASLKPAKKNLRSAMEHPDVVQEYLENEIWEKRVIGPFDKGTTPLAQINRFGVIPKSHQPHKWRLIVDLSYPRGNSVNDGVPKDLCSTVYVTIDDAISKILELGPEALLAKIDIKSAFRLIPVHPADRHLLAMEWEGKVLIDTCLPFGLRSAPKLFNIMADLLAWILDVQGVSYLIHYLDDFLTIGAPGSSECERNLETLIQVCQVVGVPLATEKVAGPATTLEFLGILLDTARMEARLPNEKLARVRQTVTVWLGKKSATKREILSLVGLLKHAAKVVRPGRDVCETHVQCGTPSTRTRLFHQAQSGIPVRPILVAYLPARLEWCQPSSTSGNCTASHDPPYRRIGDLGLWGSSLSSVVSVAMARGMVISSDYDQGTRSYRTSLCGVGPTVGPKNSPGSV